MSDLLTMLKESYAAQVNEANTLAEQVNVKSTGLGKQVAEVRKTHEDERLVKFRANLDALDTRRAEMVAKADAIAAEILGVKPLSEDESKDLRDKHKVLRDTAKSSKDLIEKMAPAQGVDAREFLSGIPEFVGISGGRGGSGVGDGRGAGVPKSRFESIVLDGEELHTVKKDENGDVVTSPATLSVLASAIQKAEKVKGNDVKVSPSDLLAVLDDTEANWKEATEVEFLHLDHNVKVYPKHTDK